MVPPPNGAKPDGQGTHLSFDPDQPKRFGGSFADTRAPRGFSDLLATLASPA
jgi:hypothetical protein